MFVWSLNGRLEGPVLSTAGINGGGPLQTEAASRRARLAQLRQCFLLGWVGQLRPPRTTIVFGRSVTMARLLILWFCRR